MIERDDKKAASEQGDDKRAAPQKETGDVAAKVARCAGDPGKLAQLLRSAPPAQRDELIAEAHKLFGNGVVQQAIAMQHQPRGEQPAEASAHEARMQPDVIPVGDGGGPSTSFQFSPAQLDFDDGPVRISETATCKLSHLSKHDDSELSFDANTGQLTVGSEKFSMDLKSGNAARGKKLGLAGAEATYWNNGASHSSAKIEDGYVGVDFSTEWTIKGKDGWEATISLSGFAGVKQAPHKPPSLLQRIEHALEGALAAAVAALAAAGLALGESAPEWAPILVA